MKKIFILFFLIFVPTVVAFDCSRTINEDYCQEILDVGLNDAEEEYLLANLVYPYNYPNYDFIEEYNTAIEVIEPPENTMLYSSKQIKNAWLSFLTIFPSVYQDGTLYVPNQTKTLVAYDYDVIIPSEKATGDCKTKYSMSKNDAKITILANGRKVGEGEYATIKITRDATITAQLDILTNLKIKHYEKERYCCKYKNGRCKKWCRKCEYVRTEYQSDSLRIKESKKVKYYNKKPYANLTVTNQYYGTTKGNITATNYTYFKLLFENAYFIDQKADYSVVFEKKPYYFITLKAENSSSHKSFNINLDNKTFFVQNTEKCSLFASNHFYNYTAKCDLTLHQEDVPKLEIAERDGDLDLLIKLGIFILLCYLIYKAVKSKFVIIPILFLIIIPFVAAKEDDCGLTNLANCIPEYLYNFFLDMINAPLQPLLISIKGLLTADVGIEGFYEVWLAVCYVLSFFYLFLFLYAGFAFLTAGGNPVKRARAKESLQNSVLMILLIAASYYLYELILSVVSIMSNTVLEMIDPTFFLLTFDNFINIALEGIFVTLYVIMLTFTLLFLVLRYIFVSFGVILVPIGIFCYFIPPLKSYGRFILNVLAIFLFVVIIDLLIILVCSIIIEAPVFASIKIVVMIACFMLIDYSLFWAIKFAITKSSVDSLKDDVQQAVKYITLVV